MALRVPFFWRFLDMLHGVYSRSLLFRLRRKKVLE